MKQKHLSRLCLNSFLATLFLFAAENCFSQSNCLLIDSIFKNEFILESIQEFKDDHEYKARYILDSTGGFLDCKQVEIYGRIIPILKDDMNYEIQALNIYSGMIDGVFSVSLFKHYKWYGYKKNGYPIPENQLPHIDGPTIDFNVIFTNDSFEFCCFKRGNY
jgi:hypothetical protein